MHSKTQDKSMDPGYIVLIVIACLVFLFGVGMCTCVLYKKSKASKEAHYTTLYDKANNGGDDGEDLDEA
jgi:flagellar basal body-associated protein FliL